MESAASPEYAAPGLGARAATGGGRVPWPLTSGTVPRAARPSGPAGLLPPGWRLAGAASDIILCIAEYIVAVSRAG